ncbi:hypothetical protein OnM2_090029 [Erysiphe neolycopersici]|uniref:Uncharacterized protein n=1 Tax=Erysiphe neolycopersici TaxID=212602 RepID=A0A420HD65_9PEZI|nr:hypothetical protein OnM2_090029 [Erysiphe neolycopersici]
MNYNNCVDQSPNTGGAVNARYQTPSQSTQGVSLPPSGVNGINVMGPLCVGGGNVGGPGAGPGVAMNYPIPVGHQTDLTFIMSLVEELSRVLHANQNLTAGVVERIGEVREKAMHMNLENDELLTEVAENINQESCNIEKENSELRQALEKTEFEKEQNWKLAVYAAKILTDLTERLHKFKELHEIDTLVWHKNYRKQLAAEREENLRLRCQVDDMKSAAGKANQSLREMRRYITDKNEWHELKVQNCALRQEKRYWKRLALPLVPDDDSEWSGDDDLIDPEEKKRILTLNEVEKIPVDISDCGSSEVLPF